MPAPNKYFLFHIYFFKLKNKFPTLKIRTSYPQKGRQAELARSLYMPNVFSSFVEVLCEYTVYICFSFKVCRFTLARDIVTPISRCFVWTFPYVTYFPKQLASLPDPQLSLPIFFSLPQYDPP